MKIGIGFLAQVGGVGLGFLFTLLITRIFSPSDVGSYYVTLTLANVGGVLGAAGLGPAALQVMSAEDSSERRGAVSTAALGASLVGGLVAGCVLLGVELGGGLGRLFPDVAPGLWRWAAIPAVALALVVREVFRAEGVGHVALAVDQLFKNVLKIAVVLLAAAGLASASADLLYASLVLGAAVSAALGAVLLQRRVPVRVDAERLLPDLRHLGGIGAPLLLNGMVWLALGWTDTLMLGGLRGSEETAFYSVALKIATLAAMGLVAVSAVLPKSFGTHWRNGARAEAGEVLRESGFVAGTLAVSVAVTFGILARDVLAVFGAPYVVADGALRILLVGQAFHALSGFAGIALNLVGGHRQVLAVNSVAAILNLLLNALLIPPYGIVGAAAASATSLVVVNLFQGRLLVRRWGTRWFAARPMALMGIGLVSAVGALGLSALSLGPLGSTVGAVALAGTVAGGAYLAWERGAR